MNLSPRCGTFALIACAALHLASCYPRADRYLDGIERPARDSDAPVEIFYAGTAPTRPHKPIILLRITANNGPDVLGKMRRECRKYGADGAIFQTVRGTQGESDLIGSGSSRDTVEALGFIYTDVPLQAAPAQAPAEPPRKHGK